MDDWFSFEGRIEPMIWNDTTYTILRLPDDVAEALAAAGAKRVDGEINDLPVNLALTRAPPVAGVFLWAGRSLLDRIGVEPGDWLDVRLRPSAADAVDWETLTPGKRRGMQHQVANAKTALTQARRIAALVSQVGG